MSEPRLSEHDLAELDRLDQQHARLSRKALLAIDDQLLTYCDIVREHGKPADFRHEIAAKRESFVTDFGSEAFGYLCGGLDDIDAIFN